MQRAVIVVAAASLIATLAACRAQAPTTPPADTPANPPVDKTAADLQQVLNGLKPGDYISLRVLNARPNGPPQSRVVNIRVD